MKNKSLTGNILLEYLLFSVHKTLFRTVWPEIHMRRKLSPTDDDMCSENCDELRVKMKKEQREGG
jgi:hypothetical protein